MEYPKEIFVKDYFEIHNYYSNMYGKNRTIILMQVGSFHEAYCTDNEGIDLIRLSQELDIYCTQKNGNLPLSKTNPRMMGFPLYVTHTYIDKLVDMNYTVVLIDQTTEPPNPKREVTGIYSPATHINNKTNKTNFLISIVIDKIKEAKTNTMQLCIGLSSYDLSTGEGSVYETYSKSNDVLIGLDDALRFMENYPPREIILENNLASDDSFANMKIDEILCYLNINPANTYSIKINQHKKLAWQKNLFNQIYKIESNIDPIELLGLQFLNWGRFSLVLLLDYVMNHQPRLLESLRVPNLFSSNKYLYLGNRALEQLDIFNKSSSETNLFNVINYTKTAIGKRFLSCQLSMPLIDPKELDTRYELINLLLESNHQNKIINLLEDIYDLDKLIRRLEISILNPNELHQIYESIHETERLCNYFKENKLLKSFDIDTKLVKQTSNLKQWIETRFQLNKMNQIKNTPNSEVDCSFYNKGIHESIDKLQDQIDSAQNFMEYLIKELEKYIDDKVYFTKEKKKTNTNTNTNTKEADSDDNIKSDSKSLISLKYNDRDGHYMLITTRRCEILKKNLDKNKIKTLNVGSIVLNVNDLEFSELPRSSNTKINCKKVKDLSLDLIKYKEQMNKKLKELFKVDMNSLLESYGAVLNLWSKKISYIDFINSGALCAQSNHYSRPIINIKQASYFKAKEMRHPIIEKIHNDTNYIPHDIELGFETKQNGILLYGINSSGKSTLMKSIGLNIILAQIGYYVCCTTFEFSPYNSLFTRISGNDNMFRGLSSFMVEMMELMAILKRNDSKTMVIGDEICRGTEEKSANIIVCYMLETLAKSDSSFITATHLHRIASLESVKVLERVKAKHLKISYDSIDDTLIYSRHLSDGQGDTFYGLQVAKYLMKDKIFNERTAEILKEYDNITEDKSSKYNSNVIVSSCQVCQSKSKLETHHIVWQKDFDNNQINQSKFYLQKNDSSNLVVLCQECHDKVDRDEIIINGWIETSSGRKFDYEIVEQFNKITKITKSKYSEEIISFIKSLKKKVKSDEKIAKLKVKEKFDKNITAKSIVNIWNSN
jgi:DNA mismatch repair protein MutS